MIISHTHKFIFLKPIKTAGTSIEAALSNYCSDEDIVTPLNNYWFNRDQTSSIVHRAMNAEKLEWWTKDIGQHVDVPTMRERLSEDIWSNYMKISVTRNPWDRLVSLFMWENKNDQSLKPKKRFYHRLGVPFDELGLLKRRFLQYVGGDWETNDRFYLIDGKLCADFVIRYENLSESFNALCDELNVPRVELPRLKTGIRIGDYHYSEFYDEESQSIVSERHINDIRLFGYCFQEA